MLSYGQCYNGTQYFCEQNRVSIYDCFEESDLEDEDFEPEPLYIVGASSSCIPLYNNTVQYRFECFINGLTIETCEEEPTDLISYNNCTESGFHYSCEDSIVDIRLCTGVVDRYYPNINNIEDFNPYLKQKNAEECVYIIDDIYQQFFCFETGIQIIDCVIELTNSTVPYGCQEDSNVYYGCNGTNFILSYYDDLTHELTTKNNLNFISRHGEYEPYQP
eukprot:UN27494